MREQERAGKRYILDATSAKCNVNSVTKKGGERQPNVQRVEKGAKRQRAKSREREASGEQREKAASGEETRKKMGNGGAA